MIILYAFLSQLRRSWFSSVCMSVCVYARACESVEVLPGSGSFPFSLSLSPLTLPFPFSVFNGLLFSATTRCTVQSVSLTKHDQNNKKKIINANLPNSAFVFFSVRGSVFLRFAVLFLSVCKRYSTHVTFSLLHCFKRSLFKFFFVLLNVSFFLYCFSLFLNFCPSSPSSAQRRRRRKVT